MDVKLSTRRRLAIAAAALGLTLVVSWPLPRCFATCLGASEDPLLSVYFLRWMTHALITPGVRLLDAGIFAPYPRTLALGEYLPTYALASVPAVLLTGNPVVAHNVVLVLAYTLAALGAAALAARVVGAWPAGLLAGLVFAFSPRLLHQAHNLQALSAFWLPWLFLGLERLLGCPTWGRAAVFAAVALALAGSSLVAFSFAAVALAVFTGAAGLAGARRLDRAVLVRLAGVALPAAAILAIYVAPYRALAREWHLARTLDEVERYSARGGDWLGVPPEHLLHRWIGVGRVVDLDREALFPGLTAGVLAAVGLAAILRDRGGLRARLGPYAALAGVAVVLALGPTLEVGGGRLGLPYRLLYLGVPGFDAIRTPRRFAAFVVLGFALLAAAGAARLVGRLAPPARPAALAGLGLLILLESVGAPFPGAVRRLDTAAFPAVYRWLAAEPPGTMALEWPMDADWEKVAPAAFHLRPTVNGWSSYFPPHYLAFVEAMAAFPDARTLALVAGVRPDVVLVDRRRLDPPRTDALAEPGAGLSRERVIGDHLVFRVTAPPPPGPEALEVTAMRKTGEVCVTLGNRGSAFVPLYPLRQLRLALESEPAGPAATAVRWLPLDLAPGAAHTECVRLRETASLPGLRVVGVIQGAGRLHRFVVTPDGPARHPASGVGDEGSRLGALTPPARPPTDGLPSAGRPSPSAVGPALQSGRRPAGAPRGSGAPCCGAGSSRSARTRTRGGDARSATWVHAWVVQKRRLSRDRGEPDRRRCRNFGSLGPGVGRE